MKNTVLRAAAPIIGASVLLVFFAACAGRQQFEIKSIPEDRLASYLADKPQSLHPGFQKLLEEGQRNVVLNNMRLGTDALRLGYVDIAAYCFDRVLTHIETVFADNEVAKKARSLWYEEGMKDFKGSPYERAMAYYYRGLIYLLEMDFENARACFKSGILQDAFAEEKQYQCDFALLIFLEGYASQLLENRVMCSAAYEEMKKLRPDFPHPPGDGNVLLLLETGSSPRKLADGIGHGELKFFRGRNNVVKQVVVRWDKEEFKVYPIEDIAWQAMTRGGRPVDKIVDGQIQFRKTNEEISTTLTSASSKLIYASPLLNAFSSVGQGVGASIGLLGIAQMQMAARTRTHADTRYWENLPDTVHLARLQLRPGKWQLKFEFQGADGALIFEETQDVMISDVQKHHLLWKRRGEDGVFKTL